MAESPTEALRRRSKALIVIVGYPESGWSVSVRPEPSGGLVSVSGHSLDECCTKMLGVLDGVPPAKPRIVLKRQR